MRYLTILALSSLFAGSCIAAEGNAKFSNLIVDNTVTFNGLVAGTGGTVLCINGNLVFAGGCSAGSGFVTTSPGAAAGQIPFYTTPSNIAPSSLTDNGTTVTTFEPFTTTSNLSGNSIYIGTTQIVTPARSIGNVVNIINSGFTQTTGNLSAGGTVTFTGLSSGASGTSVCINGSNQLITGCAVSLPPSITQYGCVSGMSDATSCMNAAFAANAGGGVLIPAGVWNVGTGGGHLIIPSSGIYITGEGSGSQIWRAGNLSSSTVGVFDLNNCTNVRITNLWIDGQTSVPATQDYATITGALQSNFTQNTTFWIHGGSNIRIDHVLIQHTGGYAILMDATTANINNVLVTNSIFQNNRSFLFGTGSDFTYGSWTGGVLLISDGANFNLQNVTVSNSTFSWDTGHCIWMKSLLSVPTLLNKNIKFVSNHFQDVGMDGVQLGVVDDAVVADSNFLRVGYVTTTDYVNGTPKWYNGTASIPAVAIDSTTQTLHFVINGNTVIAHNGGCIDLDGAGYGTISANHCLVPFPGDPEYAASQPSIWGPAVGPGIPSPGQNWMYGISTGNTNDLAQGGVFISITGNEILGQGGGAIRLYAARDSQATNNEVAPSATEVRSYPIVIGPRGSDPNRQACADEVANNRLTYTGTTTIPVVYEDPQYAAFTSGCTNRVHDNMYTGTGSNISPPFAKDPNSGSVYYGANVNFSTTPTSSFYVVDSLYCPGSNAICGGANSTAVTPTTPLLLYSHFRDDDKTHVYLSYSRDYLNYRPLNKTGSFSSTENRDPSIYWNGSTFYIIASPTPSAPALVQIWNSTDLVHFSGPITLDMGTILTGCNRAFAPEWNPPNIGGQIGFWVALSNTTSGNPVFTPYFIHYNPAVGGSFTGTAVTLTGTAMSFVFDFFPYYDAPSNSYYLQYVDEYAAIGGFPYYQQIAYAKSSSLLGTYVQQTVPTSPTSADHFGFSKTSEGPSIMPLADSVTRYGVADCIRNYADTWLNMFDNTGNSPRKYLWQYVDTCPSGVGGDPFAVVKIGPDPSNISASEQGTVIAITDQQTANIVYKAEDSAHNELQNQDRHGIGTPGFAFYTETIESKYAHYFLGYDESATYAAGGPDPGAVHGPNSYATWSACGINQYSCPPPIGGEDRWIHQYQGTGGGSIQMNNTNVDIGETSILMANSLFAFGPIPLTASALGQKGTWSIGENNQFFGPIPSGGNVANNWFYIYNAGLGPLQGTNPTVTNPGFETGSFSGWTTTGTTAIVTTPVQAGTYAASLVATATVAQTVSGIVNGTQYELTGWVQSASGSSGGMSFAVNDCASGPTITSATILSINTWYQVGVNYTGTSSGTFCLTFTNSGSGTSYLDSVQVYRTAAPLGSFALGISPSTGEVRVNYGLTIGEGDNTAIINRSNISLSSTLLNVLDIGDGVLGHFNGIVNLGYVNAGTGYTLGGTPSVQNIFLASPLANVLTIGDSFTTNNGIVNLGYVNAGTGYTLGGTSVAQNIFLASPLPNVMTIGDSFVTNNGIVNLGFVNAGTGYTVGGSPSAQNVFIWSSTPNVLEIGDSFSHNNGIVQAGIFDAQTLYRTAGTDGVSSSITCTPHNVTAPVVGGGGGTVTISVCTFVDANTFRGGIKTF